MTVPCYGTLMTNISDEFSEIERVHRTTLPSATWEEVGR